MSSGECWVESKPVVLVWGCRGVGELVALHGPGADEGAPEGDWGWTSTLPSNGLYSPMNQGTRWSRLFDE